MTSDSSSKAAATLSGAARLALLVRHASSDKELRESGTRIVYAVDTSVLQLDIAPDRGKPDLFFVQDPSTLTAYVSALAHFIFYQLQEAPLAIIPPHDAEILGVVAAIAGNAETRARIELPDAVAEVARTGTPPAKVMEVLLAKAPTVVRALLDIGDKGPVRELQRYRSMLSRRRLQNIIRRDDLPVPERRDWVNMEVRAADLYRKLRPGKGVTDKINVMRDARVVAYLEWIHSRATNIVVHLIAFDDALMSIVDSEAAAGRPHLVRDPRYFLAMSGEQRAAPVGDMPGWIREVLLGICPKNRGYYEWLAEVAASPSKTPELDSPQAERSLEELGARLQSYVREVSLGYGLLDSDVLGGAHRSSASRSESALKYLRENQSRLGDLLRDKINQTVMEIDRLAVKAGFYVMADGDPEFTQSLRELVDKDVRYSGVSRAPVWFRFERINEWTSALQEALQSKSINLRRAATAFNWGGEDSRKQYEVRIVYAYVLSLRGHWDAAQIHCLRAKKIADDSLEPVVAYDAAYFRAVCLRHLAKSEVEVEKAEQELDDAEDRWRKAHIGDPTRDPRFLVERQVQRFLRWEIRNADVLARRVRASEPERAALESLIQGMKGLWMEVVEEHSPSIRASLVQQLFTNLAESTFIEHLILEVPTTVAPQELLRMFEFGREQGLIEGDNAPVFVRIMTSLVEWLASSSDVVKRSVMREKVRGNIKTYLQEPVFRFEDGLMRSILLTIEPK